MDYYDEDECNTYVGTDSTVFPAFLPLDEGTYIRFFFIKFPKFDFFSFAGAFAFEPSICRSLGLTFQKKMKANGLPVYRFELDMGEDLNVKKCFCRDEDNCPAKGSIDLFRCTGVPMLSSLPHFLLADELLEGIESGLNPNKEEHGIFMNFEIVSRQSLF